MSRVNVVIPCYNYGRFLRECVASVLDDQPETDVRVLIIDDASTDDSAAIAEDIASSDKRVEVLVHPVNKGHIATYNEGLIEWADGDYCVLLDADDRLTPGALRRAADFLDAHPKVGFVYGHPLHFRHGVPLPKASTRISGYSVWSGHWWLKRRFREANGCITTPEVVVRTSVQHQAGGYDPRLPHTGDIEMWMRLSTYADVGYVRGADQAYYRVHDQNMSKARDQLVNLRQRRLAYELLLERRADVLPDASALSAIVHRKLAKEALRIAARAYDRRRVGSTRVDDLEAFARDCWPETDRMPGYWGLQARKQIGPQAMPYLQPLLVSPMIHKARSWLWWQSWKRRGL